MIMNWIRVDQFLFRALLFIAATLALGPAVRGQLPLPAAAKNAAKEEPQPPGKEAAPEAPAAQVEVEPRVQDEQIARRLERILQATPDWFYEPDVSVQEGVAFLRGQTNTDERKTWAGELARGTEGVVAVVNLIDVIPGNAWDFGPAFAGMAQLWRQSIRQLPWVVFSLAIIALAFVVARLTRMFLQYALRNRFGSQLLRNITSWLGGIIVFLGGLYVVLYVSGLTGIALTVLGGTGLIGLVLGIGFRDITENFLASIFLSVQTPFRNNDIVEVNGITGIVQRMTIRSTVLMTFQGNHVQIPNSVIYKSTITNYTSNPNRRDDFDIGIGYDVDVAKAQESAMDVLKTHPAVLSDPEPIVLATSLEASSVNLRVYYWVNVREHSWEKVRSSVLRLVKQRFETDGITMPDAAREIVFPRGVPIQMPDGEDHRRSRTEHTKRVRPAVRPPKGAVSTTAEGGLGSETEKLKEQAEKARPPEEGTDLLKKPEAETAESDHPAEQAAAGS
jgi:small-conductance mechanosensitive channel